MTLRTSFPGALWVACALSPLAWCGTVVAQADPTRPTFVAPVAPVGAPMGGMAPAGMAGAPVYRAPQRPAPAPVPRVSSVVVAAPEYSSAVINDRLYRLGDKVADLGTLVAIDPTGVTLKAAGGTRRLALWSRKAVPSAKAASAVQAASTEPKSGQSSTSSSAADAAKE
ncbi:MAG: hypothetical protein RLZZ182_1687 [Pseudomonadota bacterium]|jgi:hypothetical protein